ncbi:MAG: ATP synthase subunit I [Methylococcales bacterium]|nr:ATP synthase subunit I [Methylococcales bacterium]
MHKHFSVYRRVIVLQVALVSIIAAVYLALAGVGQARMALLGGLAALIPNLCFIGRIHWAGAKDPKKMLRTLYSGEALKLTLTGVMFFFIMQLPELHIGPLLVGYMSALTAYWWALLMPDNH